MDGLGLRVDVLARASVDAVVLTPAHQHPTGVVLAPERRAALIAWLRASGAIAVEDDYDAEYRYDRPAVGALQGLDQDHVVYAGTASKVLAPALRLGWMVLPPGLVDAVRREKLLHDQGTARIEQLAFARFLERGDLDRHLRKMRARYRARRDVMVSALAEHLPEATVRGIAAGLHVTVELPPGADEAAVAAAARSRGIALATMSDYWTSGHYPPTLILGYSQMTESRLRAGIADLPSPSAALRPRDLGGLMAGFCSPPPVQDRGLEPRCLDVPMLVIGKVARTLAGALCAAGLAAGCSDSDDAPDPPDGGIVTVTTMRGALLQAADIGPTWKPPTASADPERLVPFCGGAATAPPMLPGAEVVSVPLVDEGNEGAQTLTRPPWSTRTRPRRRPGWPRCAPSRTAARRPSRCRPRSATYVPSPPTPRPRAPPS